MVCVEMFDCLTAPISRVIRFNQQRSHTMLLYSRTTDRAFNGIQYKIITKQCFSPRTEEKQRRKTHIHILEEKNKNIITKRYWGHERNKLFYWRDFKKTMKKPIADRGRIRRRRREKNEYQKWYRYVQENENSNWLTYYWIWIFFSRSRFSILRCVVAVVLLFFEISTSLGKRVRIAMRRMWILQFNFITFLVWAIGNKHNITILVISIRIPLGVKRACISSQDQLSRNGSIRFIPFFWW